MNRRRVALAARRVALGHTQETFAERLGVERSTVLRWESGKSAPHPWVRPKIATALSITLDDLAAMLSSDGTGGTAQAGVDMHGGIDSQGDLVHAQIPALRRVLDAHDLVDDGPTRTRRELEPVVAAVVASRLQSRYGDLAMQIPVLLPELIRAFGSVEGAERAAVAGLLAQAYRAADAIADKYGYYDLSARIIGLMEWAARESGDDLLIGTAAYVRAETFFANGDLHTGRRMLEKAAGPLQARGSANAEAVYGALHMRAAVTAARAGLAARARDHLAEAQGSALQVDEGVYFGTAFGPASVRIHRVSLAVELGDTGSALLTAAGWSPPTNLPAERRSHFHVDLGRAHHQAGRPEQSLEALLAARAAAPEHIQSHPQVREIIRHIHQSHPTPTSTLVEFSRWMSRPARMA